LRTRTRCAQCDIRIRIIIVRRVYSAVRHGGRGGGSPGLNRLYSCTAAGLGPAPRVISYVNGNTSRRRRHWRTTSHIICIYPHYTYSEPATLQNNGAKVFPKQQAGEKGVFRGAKQKCAHIISPTDSRLGFFMLNDSSIYVCTILYIILYFSHGVCGCAAGEHSTPRVGHVQLAI